ncbi:hypothetical protein NE237_027281 [Protea cynaroides]|uniref:Uncharacterized protein n=1 Tax=Protea cynaroides TaxID=273540 RepID=A0A9Q0JRS1_9MAGN|nr:hypothetical protein NE237_027281 [Protea cynaroides]
MLPSRAAILRDCGKSLSYATRGAEAELWARGAALAQASLPSHLSHLSDLPRPLNGSANWLFKCFFSPTPPLLMLRKEGLFSSVSIHHFIVFPLILFKQHQEIFRERFRQRNHILSEMAKFSCFYLLMGCNRKSKVEEESPDFVDDGKGLGTEIKLEHPVESSGGEEVKSTSFRFSVPSGIQEKAAGPEATQEAYEGEDEHEDNLSIKRDFSDLDLQAHESEREEREELHHSTNRKIDQGMDYQSDKDVDLGVELIQSGFVSDPGIGKAEIFASPGLQRSCSNLETRNVMKRMADGMHPQRYHSFKHFHNSRKGDEFDAGIQGSPESVMTTRSADRVMLKKQTSSQILPSRSRKLWWKLFLWSHRNLEKSRSMKTQAFSNQKGGYWSDTLEPNQAKELSKMESPGSFTEESINTSPNWNKKFNNGASGLWPQNQWVASPTESSSITRIDDWVNSLETQSLLPFNDEGMATEDIAFPPSPDACPTTRTSYMNQKSNVSEEVLHANNVIQSLKSSSTVAHISGMCLKVLPPISRFSSLRSLNLSGNLIVHITSGSLPKGLHSLNLSRNKIHAIDGLRDLTRLRVLDLSYNRISKIGQGLSDCTIIKELYLAGNKISDVEGLHRLLKLMVLDLSFNKIATAKGLGQLVANYHSLVALNLLGNPLQSNIGEDQLRKTVSGILPELAYLNKQPIKTQRAREVVFSVGLEEWTSSHRTSHKRMGLSSSSGHRNRIVRTGQKTSLRSKRTHHHSPTRRKS